MSYKTVYLTGAPAAGKSTLARTLARDIANVEVFEFGARMSDWLRSKDPFGNGIDQTKLRSGTGPHVSMADIKAVNSVMRAWIEDRGRYSHLIVDSHQVTVEDFGLIYVPFRGDELIDLPIDEIWVVDVDPHVTIGRIKKNPKGRPLPTEHMASLHSASQMCVATTYGAMKGVPVVVLDGNNNEDQLVLFATKRLRQAPVDEL